MQYSEIKRYFWEEALHLASRPVYFVPCDVSELKQLTKIDKAKYVIVSPVIEYAKNAILPSWRLCKLINDTAILLREQRNTTVCGSCHQPSFERVIGDNLE